VSGTAKPRASLQVLPPGVLVHDPTAQRQHHGLRWRHVRQDVRRPPGWASLFILAGSDYLSLRWLNDSIFVPSAVNYSSCQGCRRTRTAVVPCGWTNDMDVFSAMASDAHSIPTQVCSSNTPCVQRIRGTARHCAIQTDIHIRTDRSTGLPHHHGSVAQR